MAVGSWASSRACEANRSGRQAMNAIPPEPSAEDQQIVNERPADTGAIGPSVQPNGRTTMPDRAAGSPLRVLKGEARSSDWDCGDGPESGARLVITGAEQLTLGLLALLIVVGLFVQLRYTLVASIAFVTALYLGTGGYKIWLMAWGEFGSARYSPPPPAEGDDLPVYTVLIPLYRESRILPVLVDRLAQLDYPADRLQVLLLIEADDDETQLAAQELELPRGMQFVTVPLGQPRTKPRALNVGLQFAQGDYVVVYDAEDRPEPDQLRKAVAAFRRLPDDVVCLQARLNFYNRYQSLLARLFAVDYATWYDQFLPGLTDSGLARPGVFVPLGGTSNHFRIASLRALSGWDPYNVTEDCDLGTRLGRGGLRTGLLDSVTWEEAVPRVRPWIKQRSRWVKGYLQTYLVHMRRPAQLWRELGARGFLDFQLLVGANSLILLLNPLMWLLTAAYVATSGSSRAFVESLFPTWLYYPALLSFVIGNFVLLYSWIFVCVRRGYAELTRVALLAPLYWVLLSVGAWVGLISLIRNPFYWAKTEHGVSLTRDSTAPPSPATVAARAEQVV